MWSDVHRNKKKLSKIDEPFSALKPHVDETIFMLNKALCAIPAVDKAP